MELDALQKEIRRSCPARVWSQGVRLAREDAVSGESASADEVVLRVRAPGRAVAPTVVLYPVDLEWECDCPNSEDTCAHVCAAVIALVQARKQGHELPGADNAGSKVRYRFLRSEGSLALTRVIVASDGREHPIAHTLVATMDDPPGGAPISPEQSDLNVDRLLGARAAGRIPSDRLENLLIALAGHGEIFLDDEPVTVTEEVLVPHAVLDDSPSGVRFTLTADPRVDEVVAPGVARCGRELCRLGELELCGTRLERLPAVRELGRRELADFFERELPALEARIPVERRTSRAPKVDRSARPDMVIDVSYDGHSLAVLPLLFYVDERGQRIARVDGERLVAVGAKDLLPARDQAAEKRLRHRLRDELNLVPGQRVVFEGRDAAGFQQRLRAWGGTLEGDVARERFWDVAPLEPRLSVRGELVDIYFAAPGAGAEAGHAEGRAGAAEVLHAWRRGDGLVALTGGGWAPVPAVWLEAHGQLVADLLAARTPDGRVPAFAQPDLAQLCDQLDHPRPPGLDRLTPLFEGFSGLPEVVLPTDLDATLRPYQHIGVRWLSFLDSAGLGAILADDMGLGKTLQTLCVLTGRTLIVSPTSVIHNWASEIARFRPRLRVLLYHGSRRGLDSLEHSDVVLTTYALLRLDLDALAAIRWDAVVLDEAQAIKNPHSQVARAAYRLEAGFRVALSGTPVENRLEELWSLMHFANRGLLGGRKDFQERYAEPVARGDAGATARLRARIGPFLLRRRKRDVAPELPPRTEAVLYCELEERERAQYDAVRAAARQDVLDRLAQGGNVLAALEALLRLRQAACHTGLLPSVDAESSSKVALLVDALRLVADEDGKALVFSQWTGLLDLIEPHLRTAEIDFVRLDGSTRDRAGVVATFQREAGPPVMLISLKAGGTGLNLTAADHVFLCDPWWNPAAEDQAADRAHRIGQDRPVMVYRLVAKDTVEERILELQQRKRALADTALGEAERAAALTRDDLMALLA
ncbi:SNF2-related protein [Haliangium sp.]|uniref:SNF2-related protein n=1 Tax=Haliangium sp. TaxID=2663208 RepID=UPI003D10ACAF